MYPIIDELHSVIRWILLVFCVEVIVKSLYGWLKKKEFTKVDNSISLYLLIFTHLQLLLGLLLYFVFSNKTKTAFANFGMAMKDPDLRFYAVEHITIMLIAVVMIQLGRTFSQKAADPVVKHKKLAIFTIIGFVLMLAGIPWDLLNK